VVDYSQHPREDEYVLYYPTESESSHDDAQLGVVGYD
jgi:hypothetical protein